MKVQVIIVALALIDGCTVYGLFAPRRLDEEKLVTALLHGHSASEVYSKIVNHRRILSRLMKHAHCNKHSGSAIRSEGFRSEKEYMFALEKRHRILSRNEKNAVLCATEHLGGCSRIYPTVLKSWERFFKKREFKAYPVYPDFQYKLGQKTIVNFSPFSLRQDRSDELQAVDLIVSRSSTTNQVVYGRYHFEVIGVGNTQIYDDQQATCGADENSYFALGLNAAGTTMIKHWMSRGNSSLSLTLQSETITQILRDEEGGRFVSSNLDVGPRIEAMILHLRSSAPKSLPESLFPELVSRSRKRRWIPRSGDCKRKQYLVSFRNNPNIISPETLDIGICDGSCDEARWPWAATVYNSTGHTIKMLWNKHTNNRQFGNPAPKACCYPTAYKRFIYVAIDELQNIFTDYQDDMIAVKCGCR